MNKLYIIVAFLSFSALTVQAQAFTCPTAEQWSAASFEGSFPEINGIAWDSIGDNKQAKELKGINVELDKEEKVREIRCKYGYATRMGRSGEMKSVEISGSARLDVKNVDIKDVTFDKNKIKKTSGSKLELDPDTVFTINSKHYKQIKETVSTINPEYHNEIDAFRTSLLESKKFPEKILNLVPKLEDFSIASTKLYQKLIVKADGQDARVWVGESLVDRPQVGITKGQMIAIRGARITSAQEKNSAEWTLENFVKAQNNLRKPDAPITEFFPAFYGTYEAMGKTKYSREIEPLNFQEMETIDATLADQYNCGGAVITETHFERQVAPMSDCVVFEFCLGEWAGAYFAEIGSGDAKVVNAGVKKVDYSRSYEIQGKKYIIPKTELMPKRIDLGGAGLSYISSPSLLTSYSCSLRNLSKTYRQPDTCPTSQAAQNFMNKLARKNDSIFEVFDEFYQQMSCKADMEEAQNHKFVWPQLK